MTLKEAQDKLNEIVHEINEIVGKSLLSDFAVKLGQPHVSQSYLITSADVYIEYKEAQGTSAKEKVITRAIRAIDENIVLLNNSKDKLNAI